MSAPAVGLTSDVRRAALLSLHTSPLVQPGGGDAGGMNVYIRELVSSLAQADVECTVYVRRWDADAPERVLVEPGFEVVHIDAGAVDLDKAELPGIVDAYTDRVKEHLLADPVDVIHANYWLSGVAGHRLKHEMDLPLVTTFHTLARVKAETGDPEPQLRVDAEAEVVRCADVITANSETERRQLVDLYGAAADRVELVPPGVDRAVFSPGAQSGARHALGLGPGPVLLFVGRIQPLKGADIAVGTLAALDRPDARLVIVGGPSGAEGEIEAARIKSLISDLGLVDQVDFVDPQPHHLLSTYYRAADVCLVPSRSESFGLVALEAAACGVPVVASDVGGLRTLVADGRTGFRIKLRDPELYAQAVARILDDPVLEARLRANSAAMADNYTWAATASHLRRIYDTLASRVPLDCLT